MFLSDCNSAEEVVVITGSKPQGVKIETTTEVDIHKKMKRALSSFGTSGILSDISEDAGQ